MPFRGVTFSGQNVTPKNDGGLYQAHYGDGILWGCSMAISGDDLVIQSGEFIAGGRVCQVDGATNVDLSGRGLTTGYIQVIMNYDLSQGEGSQWYTSFVESASTTFPALTQDDINDTDTLYQLELAVVQISGGSLTNITSSLKPSTVLVRNSAVLYDENGNAIGKASSYNGETDFCSTDADGNPTSGMFTGGSTPVIYANNNNIVFRPKGRDNMNDQLSIDPSGLIHGGYLYSEDINTSTVNVGNAYQATSYKTYSEGLWQLHFQMEFTPAGGGNVFALLITEGNSQINGRIGKETIYCGNTSSYGITCTALVKFTQNTIVSFHTYGGVGFTRTYLKIASARLG